jgi:glycosyltransferase involved in cell wall biosynthesis
MRVLVVLPTYNEAENVTWLLPRIRELEPAFDLLVVDDASPDGTAELVRRQMARDAQLHLIERERKAGLGTAYRAGFAWGLERAYDTLLQMDCDGSHDPRALAAFAARIEEHDLVIGSRYVPGGSVEQWQPFRRALSRWANRFARAVLGLPIRDLTGGFNAWRAEALERLGYSRVASRGYAFQIEMKYRACLAGLSWTEFPIVFVDRRQGRSKIPRSEVVTSLWRVLQWRLRPPKLPAR